MKMGLVTSFLSLSLVTSGLLHAQTTPREALLILAKRDHTLAIVDPASLKVLTRIPVGNDPHEVVASSDGRTAYVSNYGGGAFNTLTVVDLVEQKPEGTIDLGELRGPHGLVFVGGKTWFTAEGAKAIGRYDPATKKIDWVLGTGQNRTHMIYVSPEMKRVVTTNVSSGTVSIIEETTSTGPVGSPPGPPNRPPGPGGPPPGPRIDWNQTLVTVGNGPEGFDVSPDDKEIWVANAHDGTVSIIDAVSKKVAETLTADVMGANRLKFTPDGKMVLISSLGGSALTVIDARSRKTVKRIEIGHGAAGIQMQPDGSRAFVACSPDDYVTVIDLKSLQVAGRIEAGHEPDGLAWAVQH
jgi:YVTN family beta-propeller protein